MCFVFCSHTVTGFEKNTKNQKEKLEKWNMEIIISNKIQSAKEKKR